MMVDVVAMVVFVMVAGKDAKAAGERRGSLLTSCPSMRPSQLG
jgi:hypothetical protein